jgi:hypothetical protein
MLVYRIQTGEGFPGDLYVETGHVTRFGLFGMVAETCPDGSTNGATVGAPDELAHETLSAPIETGGSFSFSYSRVGPEGRGTATATIKGQISGSSLSGTIETTDTHALPSPPNPPETYANCRGSTTYIGSRTTSGR